MEGPNRQQSGNSSFILERASRDSNRASLDLFGRESNRGSLEGSEGSSRDSRVAVSMPDPDARKLSLSELHRAAEKARPPMSVHFMWRMCNRLGRACLGNMDSSTGFDQLVASGLRRACCCFPPSAAC